ncbi:MAG: DUF488 domain-containing protein [Phycisphaerales bacterium]|nr:DUF488 domain-containing protein [Phycisphaerales bacterium]MCI0629752.1 DUF488 domain-containing protein [Phycisphaerales bacterium]MCI0674400.1 DUF488 domain-containing protein [Phycisphaerales bacterium]
MITTSGPGSQTIYTLGHSTRSLSDFLTLLHHHNIRAIADVRQYPRSRRHPHFNSDSLAAALPASNIDYLPFSSLGGRRTPSPHSINTAWRNDAFRGYADFMQTPEFTGALDHLIAQASLRPTAIMCAEALPWKCHRSLIADALLIRNWQVLNIISNDPPKPHQLPPFAHVNGNHLTYPANQAELFSASRKAVGEVSAAETILIRRRPPEHCPPCTSISSSCARLLPTVFPFGMTAIQP